MHPHKSQPFTFPIGRPFTFPLLDNPYSHWPAIHTYIDQQSITSTGEPPTPTLVSGLQTHRGPCAASWGQWPVPRLPPSLTAGMSHSHDHDGYTNTRGQDPDANVDQLGLGGCAEVQSLDRVADGDIAVDTHHGKCENAGEHIVVVNGKHSLAEQFPKGPRLQQVLGALEGQRTGGQCICQGQVEDVDVGGRLHLSVP